MTQPIRIAIPPRKPLMIYDGDCNFCKFWIIRWQLKIGRIVEFVPSQDPSVAQRFPEIPREHFQRSVQLIEPDGIVSSGANAVFRALAYNPFWQWPLWLYHAIPGVRPVTEFAYRFVAARREGFSTLTRILWGREGALPTYSRARWLFLRALGIIYLFAFLSLGSQILGLVGTQGITPAKDWLSEVRAQCDQNHIGLDRYHLVPTLCWFSASDASLKTLCLVGAILSLLLIADIAPAVCLFLLWLIYLSLTSIGGVFLSFQWDMLLLETGFLAIWFAPPQLLPLRKGVAPPSRAILWLLRWLLFRLMFESGLVKLISGDLNWRHLTALNFHYETQPLPTWIGWYAAHLPEGFQKTSVVVMFVIELAVPFLIFAPRRLRFIGCAALVFLQVCIFLTGNYCFFNLLTVALCILLLDDAFIGKFIPRKWRRTTLPDQPSASSEGPALQQITVPAAPVSLNPSHRRNWPTLLIAPIFILLLIITTTQLLVVAGLRIFPDPVIEMTQWSETLRSANSYGLFMVMTTSRHEIIIQGSDDGETWTDYDFKYKPGDPKQRPGFVAPHQPRLDWQMWFAALSDVRENHWLVNFCGRLLQGSPSVEALLKTNPFPKAPPKYIRAVVYDYHFTTLEQHRADGTWWRRQYLGEYLPPSNLRGKPE